MFPSRLASWAGDVYTNDDGINDINSNDSKDNCNNNNNCILFIKSN